MPLASDRRPRAGSGHTLHSPSGDPGRSVRGDRCRWSRRQGKPAAGSAVGALSATADAPRSVLREIVYRARQVCGGAPTGSVVQQCGGGRGPGACRRRTAWGSRPVEAAEDCRRAGRELGVSTGEAFARGFTESESGEAQDRDPDVPPNLDGVADRVGDTRLNRPDGGCGGPASLAYGQLHGSAQLYDAIRE